MTVDHTTKGRRIGLLISYYIVLSFWACAALCLSLVSRNVAGQTKKATIVATNFVGWATGNSIGSLPCFSSIFHYSFLIYKTTSLDAVLRTNQKVK